MHHVEGQIFMATDRLESNPIPLVIIFMFIITINIPITLNPLVLVRVVGH